MTYLDQFIHSLSWRLYRSDAGIAICRLIRWGVPLVFPYDPPRSVLSALVTCPNFRVEVKTSTIAGAGDGLFALEDIPEGAVLGEYGGDRVTSLAKWIRLRDKGYVMTTDVPNLVIDAWARPEVLLRYVNHQFDPQRRNLIREAKGEIVYFVTTQAISSGEEFFVDYGDLYWKLRGVKSVATEKTAATPNDEPL
jgi:SET domain